ncbi:MAG TPA: alginate export family protein [Bacteroidales bacterium]|nr:alginate export family protein [Bacteroidales bacterium]
MCSKVIPFLIALFYIIPGSLVSGQDIDDIRSLDNNHALATDTGDWKLHRAVKEILLQKSNPVAVLSLGGEIREQLRYFNHVNFGDVTSGSSDQDLYLQHRFMLHADLRVNRNLRLFTQVNSCHVTGKNTPSPQVDRDDLGIMQFFADIGLHAAIPIRLRLGRQEFAFGPERMLGLRNGPTIRQTFDGVRLTLGSNRVSGDFFVVQPVSYQFGVFDNSRRNNEFVYATYWQLSLKDENFLDLYYFGVQSENIILVNDTARDNRHSAGIRFSKETGAFWYDAEFTFQSGHHSKNTIRAWQFSSLLSYSWQDLSWRPRLQIREAIFSGDKKPGDDVLNTFRPVSAKPPIHDLVPVGPANLVAMSPEAEINLFGDAFVLLSYYAVWRFSANDGMYPPNVREMTREPDSPGEERGKTITKGIAAEFSWDINKHTNILVFGGLFRAGEFIRNTGTGRNVEAFSIRATYKL